MKPLRADQGMLHYLVKSVRPEIAAHIAQTGVAETIIIGLGSQGTKHAGLMMQYGTSVVAGISPGQGGARVQETIPVYDTVADCLVEHPWIAAASIWKHYSTARDAAIEAIEAGIPLVVLISEGLPLRDVRDVLTAARRHGAILFGGNTPGIIFPPEAIKIGMLPDIFHPQELPDDAAGPNGVTIISRSGAILYHLSDALASIGIAQNAVLGIGGDGAIGSPFRDLVPLVMAYDHTDLVVVAGEIGGCMEELLAEDVKTHPEKYPKPLVALISGAHAPEGKTMGHAGAIVSPGQPYGTFLTKKTALENAGVPVVNSQYDLIELVQKMLRGKKYFHVEHYYAKMSQVWELPQAKPSWGTVIAKVQPNLLLISGYPLQELVERSSLLETAHLLIQGELPNATDLEANRELALQAFSQPLPAIERVPEDISKTLAKYLLLDQALAETRFEGRRAKVQMGMFLLGRTVRYLAQIIGSQPLPGAPPVDSSPMDAAAHTKPHVMDEFSELIFTSLTGRSPVNRDEVRLIEAMVVASVDHGVTPPSAQAAILAASVRPAIEVAIAHGVGAITDVHGGAGANAAAFFAACAAYARTQQLPLYQATVELMKQAIRDGKRIEGLGHRLHTQDPRRDILWQLAQSCGVASDCVAVSRLASEAFNAVRGIELPINVDGVIGAIVADLGLAPVLAKAIFILGRVAGLCAHYFEEVSSQPPMRRINFSEAVYRGKELRHYPGV